MELADTAWVRVWGLYGELTVSQILRRKNGVGPTPSSIKDALAHVYAWHDLALGWLRTGRNGAPDLPARGFKWNQVRELNAILHNRFREMELASVVRRIKLSHGRMMKTVTSLSERDLLEPGRYVWAGQLPLASYVGPNTIGHYRWLHKKIKQRI